MNKKNLTPMTYDFDLGHDHRFILKLPCTLEQMSKKDKQKVAKHAREFAESIYHKSQLEARSRIAALEAEIAELKRNYAL